MSVIERYVHMGMARYLRDFRRSFELKKGAELRKRVLQRQKKNQEKTDRVPFKVGNTNIHVEMNSGGSKSPEH